MFFVYRSHYDGPLSKVVARLPDASVLAYYQRTWGVDPNLGCDVYGFGSVFEKAFEHRLPRPATIDELRAVLDEHLYVEGEFRLDEHSLRALTDDDEVALAWFLLSDDVVAANPDRLAYLLHEQWPLPSASGPPAPFDPGVPVTVLGEPGPADDTTYAVLLTFYDGDSVGSSTPIAFPGVTLADLPARLRSAEVSDDWPPELLVLRALTAPDDTSVEAGLRRCDRWPLFDIGADWPWPHLPGDHPAAHRLALPMLRPGGRPRTLLEVAPHVVQLSMHCDDEFGFQQWYLFDTGWAAANPALARSLLRYAGHWDPLAP